MGELVHGILDAADVLQLAAGVAVHELQAVLHAGFAQHAEQLEDLGDEQAELGFLARRLAPAARALARELDAHADARPHVVVARMLQDQLQLAEILDHRDDRAAELRGEDHGLDVAVVLEAVADDHPLRLALGHRHHGEQLGLRPDLEAEAELAAVAVDFLDHEPLLVHLDREHRGVAVAVVVLGDRRRERVVQPLQPMVQDVGEAHDHRRREVARLEPADDLVQVDLVVGRLVGAHHHVARGVDAEVAVAPGVDAVELERVLDLPVAAWRQLACSAFHSRRLRVGRQKVARTIAEAGPAGRAVARGRLTALRRVPPGATDRATIRSRIPGRDGRPAGRRRPSRAAGDTR